VGKALDEKVKADAEVHGGEEESAAQECKEVWVVGFAYAVVQPHAVVVKVFCASVADTAVLAAWPDVYLQKHVHK